MRILRKFKLTEISACDKPAQAAARVVIMKRAETQDAAHVGPEHARLHSFAVDLMRVKPGMSYERARANVLDANLSFRERVKAEHLAHELSNTKQSGTTKMKVDFAKMVSTEESVEFEKMIADGALADFTKTDLHHSIERRAEELREPGETLPQAYAKFITSDPVGRLAFRAYQSAKV